MVLQVGPDGAVRPLNLLDPGVLPYTRINGSTFPAPDERLAAAAPLPSQPDYGAAVVEFVRRNAPETFDGQPVRFFTTFTTTVSLADAHPQGRGDPRLLPLLNLEIWGVPTSAPARDPSNHTFVYQRFQRGIMHYDAACRCTQGLLLADYFKALITGEGLPPDLEQQARTSAFLRQYGANGQNGVNRPAALPDTDLRQAFARLTAPPPPVVAAPAVAAPPTNAAIPPAGVPSGPMRTRIRADRALWAAIDSLEDADRLELLEAMARSEAEISFGALPENVHAKYSRSAAGPDRPAARSIVVSERWRGSDPKAVATLVAHEGRHLQDDVAGADVKTREGCIQFEIRAFTEQSEVWQVFYGPRGKAKPQDDIDLELNSWLATYRRGAGELERRVRALYVRACGGPG
jgi:hypothetical protein